MNRYRARFRRVLDYIDANLDGDLGVERLSGIAAYSRFHFHRQFAASFGVTVGDYVQQLRLERASKRLAFRDAASLMSISIDSGYAGPEAFARAFRRRYGQSPSAFRDQPDWEAWHATQEPTRQLRRTHMRPTYTAEQVRIVEFPDTPVALLAHRGDPRRVGDSVRRFIDWRRENRLPPGASATFNVFHDSPEDVVSEAFRMDLCAVTGQPVAPNPQGVVAGLIPGGRCAVLRHVGDDDGMAVAATWLYAQWLPASGEEPRDYPFFLQRVRFFPEVPEHEAVTDLFLPLR